MAIVVRHPVTELTATVEDEQLAHLRQSGWETISEFNERQAQAEAQAAEQAKAEAAAARSKAKE